MDQCARWTGTHLALVEREHGKPFEAFVQEFVVFVHDVWEEHRRRLSAQFQGDWDDFFCRSLVDHLADGCGTGERDLRDAIRRRQCHTGFVAESVDDVEHTRWQQIRDLFHQVQDRDWGLFCGFQDDGVTAGQRRGKLPGCHQDWEVPRNDLADDAEWLVEVIRDGIIVDL